MTIREVIDALARGENVYKWSSYWGKWNRVVAVRERGGCLEYAEITMSPIDGRWGHEACMKIRAEIAEPRRHTTRPVRRDRFTTDIPADVVAAFEAHMGEDLTVQLLNTQYA